MSSRAPRNEQDPDFDKDLGSIFSDAFRQAEANSATSDVASRPTDAPVSLPTESALDTGAESELSRTSNTPDTVESNADAAKVQKAADAIQEGDYVEVRGTDGRKQRIKVDYSNREAIKTAFLKAHGMDQFRKERDALKTQLGSISTEKAGQDELIGQLKTAWEKEGYRGLAKVFGSTGNEADSMWAQAVDAELQRREYFASLSPDEKYRLDLQTQKEASMKEAAEMKAKYEGLLNQTASERQAAEVASLEARVVPAFDRYRFAGKLGDPQAEKMVDDALFSTVRDQLSQYPDDVQLTQALVDKHFRTESARLQKVFAMKIESGVKAAVERKKEDASRKISVAASSGLKSDGSSDFEKALESGGLRAAMASLLSKGRL